MANVTYTAQQEHYHPARNKVDKEIYLERLKVCQTCPLQQTCLERPKADEAWTHCPAYLWPKFYAPTRRKLDKANLVYHLSYHIYPKADIWRNNVTELLKRWKLFNGTKRIAIAEDSDTCSAQEVVNAFPSNEGIQWIKVRNNPALREVATFRKLLQDRPNGENDLMFCAHAKGIRYSDDLLARKEDAAVWKWVMWMYKTCLDDLDTLVRHLEMFPIVGAFKRYGSFQVPRNHKWHYSGTYYWFRCKELYAIQDWVRIEKQWFGTEAWPANHFMPHEAGCLFGDDIDNLYLDKMWNELAPHCKVYDVARNR